ncbi:MAG: hypothetical protein ACKOA9_03000 [Actinomycetota bacterium]
MNSVLLAVFGSVITAIAFAGFSIYQLEKTAAKLGKPGDGGTSPSGSEDTPKS